jgi:mannosyltransferase
VAVLVTVAAALVGRRDLWLDEAYSLAATRHLGETLAATHGTMATYYVLLTPWAAVSTSPVWLRTPSIVAMAAAVAVLALTVARQTDRRTGRAAGVLAGASQLPVLYAVEARSYALVALLAATGWYALDRALEPSGTSRRWWWAWSATCLLLPLTHGLGTAQVVMQAVALAWARPAPTHVRHIVGTAGATLALAAALVAGGLSEVGGWMPPLSADAVRDLLAAVTHPLLPVALGVTALVAIGARALIQQPEASPPPLAGTDALARYRQVALALWGPGAVVAVLALSVVRPSYMPRYSTPATLGVAGLMAVAWARAIPRTTRWVPGAVLALGAAVLVTPALNDADRGWSGAADTVAAGLQPTDRILFATPDGRIPFEAAWIAEDRPRHPEVVGPGDRVGTFDRFGSQVEAEAVIADLDPTGRVWVVEFPLFSQESHLDEVLGSPVVREGMREAGRWRWRSDRDIVVIMLEPQTPS